jgi:hypothetical protein
VSLSARERRAAFWLAAIDDPANRVGDSFCFGKNPVAGLSAIGRAKSAAA